MGDFAELAFGSIFPSLQVYDGRFSSFGVQNDSIYCPKQTGMAKLDAFHIRMGWAVNRISYVSTHPLKICFVQDDFSKPNVSNRSTQQTPKTWHARFECAYCSLRDPDISFNGFCLLQFADYDQSTCLGQELNMTTARLCPLCEKRLICAHHAMCKLCERHCATCSSCRKRNTALCSPGSLFTCVGSSST